LPVPTARGERADPACTITYIVHRPVHRASSGDGAPSGAACTVHLRTV